ncbi:MAG: methyltransferase domain-containing protein [Phycisphaerales bacterium]|nr:methyltransferase domain-containing protein [Phycisphaerales bacterium]
MDAPSYVGRGGLKLRHALTEFRVDAAGLTCADLGCNVGGFTDCLLRAGSARVYAVDTGYGALAWTLRRDPRVVVMERTNALHAGPPETVDLAVIDLGWTPQRRAVPAALRWLRPGGRIITLIKPHYEVEAAERGLLTSGVLAEPDAERIAGRTVEALPALGVRVLGLARSPISGGAGKGNRAGNAEWFALLEGA